MANYSEDEQRVLTKEMSDKIYNDSYSTTEEELQKDVNWIEATKDVYRELEGVEYSGADEDAAKTGLDIMSRFNYNLTLGTINYTAKLQDAEPKTKLAFYYMMDMYDKKDISGNGVMRAFKEMGLDPASYIGIGTLGMGFAGKQAATATAKTGLKAMLKQGAIKFLQSPAAVAATEGAIYTGVDDVARQDAAIGAGVQDEYRPGQTAVATGIGAAAGAGIVKGTQAVGRKISNVLNDGEDALRKNFEEGGSMAGGGTPPPIVQEVAQSIDKTTRDANFQNWFSGSQITDDAGDPLVVYHGTTHDFDTFSPERGNVENHHGVGFYFSDSPDDVARNYASPEGADLTNRIEQKAERLADEIMDERGIDDWDEAMEIARDEATKEISGEAPNTMPVYLALKKPVVISEDNPTWFGYSAYDPETDEYLDEAEGTGAELFDALRDQISEYDYNVADEIVGEIQEQLGYEDFRAIDLEKALRSNENFTMLQDDEGNLISNEIISDVYNDLGFDGVILKNAEEQFPNMGMSPDTTHYVVFDPKGVKSIHNKGTFSKEDANILKSLTGATATGAAISQGDDNNDNN